MSEPDEPEALPGLRKAVRASRAVTAKHKAAKAAAAEPAEVDPVARVLVDVPLAHLDRTFDYLVPSAMAADAVPGTRVKVRFAGQEVGAAWRASTPCARRRASRRAACSWRRRHRTALALTRRVDLIRRLAADRLRASRR